MGQIVIGIGEYQVSSDSSDVLKTYALGSCVAVMIYDKLMKVAGMIHIALPDSKVDQNKAKTSPGHFADTGLPLLIEQMKKKGAAKGSVWIKIAGGSNVLDPKFVFDIGKRNTLAIKKYLWQIGMGPVAEDVGGDSSRTVTMNVSDGLVEINSGKKTWQL